MIVETPLFVSSPRAIRTTASASTRSFAPDAPQRDARMSRVATRVSARVELGRAATRRRTREGARCANAATIRSTMIGRAIRNRARRATAVRFAMDAPWTRAMGTSETAATAASVGSAREASGGYAGARATTPVRGAPPLPPARERAPTRAPTGGMTAGTGRERDAVGKPALGGIVPEDIDAVYHQMQHLGNKWADAHAEAEMLEEAKKCVLATITLHYIGDGGTKAAAEVQAYASQEYQDHIKRMVEARRRANLAKIELESIKTHLNLTRTYEATRREEMKML
jgi:hypothetical protein